MTFAIQEELGFVEMKRWKQLATQCLARLSFYQKRLKILVSTWVQGSLRLCFSSSLEESLQSVSSELARSLSEVGCEWKLKRIDLKRQKI